MAADVWEVAHSWSLEDKTSRLPSLGWMQTSCLISVEFDRNAQQRIADDRRVCYTRWPYSMVTLHVRIESLLPESARRYLAHWRSSPTRTVPRKSHRLIRFARDERDHYHCPELLFFIQSHLTTWFQLHNSSTEIDFRIGIAHVLIDENSANPKKTCKVTSKR